jgi:ribA/ribD-fused uncharacterized protein
MIYNRRWVERRFRAKARPKYVFFWGHQPAADGRLTATCFSQWWPAPFSVNKVVYPTAEHWMMTQKALLFGDEEAAGRIRGASSPKQVKDYGRQVRGFDEARWSAARRDIVVTGNLEKFRQNPALAAFLLSTGTAVLVEASPVDRIWGIGLAADDERTANPLQWRGENLLGFALMEVRDRLAKG